MRYQSKIEQIDMYLLGLAAAEDAKRLVGTAEQSFHRRILEICDIVIQEERHVILVTGPSASGKTTTAQKLGDELRRRGKRVNSISLDNFYVDAHKLPKWRDGYQNYESIESLDLTHFEQKMTELLTCGKADFPIFDFSLSVRTQQTVALTFDAQTYLIIEGIHALNPLISDCVKSLASIKIYISVHSEFASGGQTILSARDLRLMRRILRDFTHRSKTAEETFRMWEYVLMGEELYIRPFRKYADLHLDSVHSYEPYLYYSDMLRALGSAAPGSPYLETFERLKASIQPFFPIGRELIPESSLIQEFIRR